jgi:hypothetical protein
MIPCYYFWRVRSVRILIHLIHVNNFKKKIAQGVFCSKNIWSCDSTYQRSIRSPPNKYNYSSLRWLPCVNWIAVHCVNSAGVTTLDYANPPQLRSIMPLPHSSHMCAQWFAVCATDIAQWKFVGPKWSFAPSLSPWCQHHNNLLIADRPDAEADRQMKILLALSLSDSHPTQHAERTRDLAMATPHQHAPMPWAPCSVRPFASQNSLNSMAGNINLGVAFRAPHTDGIQAAPSPPRCRQWLQAITHSTSSSPPPLRRKDAWKTWMSARAVSSKILSLSLLRLPDNESSARTSTVCLQPVQPSVANNRCNIYMHHNVSRARREPFWNSHIHFSRLDASNTTNVSNKKSTSTCSN